MREGEEHPTMTPSQLQSEAERIVRVQLRDIWGLELRAIDSKRQNDPDMAIELSKNSFLFVWIEGIDANLGISSREPNWVEACKEFALQEGFGGYFLKVIIGPREGEGNKIAIEGLDKLKEKLPNQAL
jgi:hypothetical protein